MQSVTSDSNYLFAGKTLNDDVNEIPVPGNSLQENLYDIHDNMIFGKYISNSDVSKMIRNVPWESGKVFAIYDNEDSDLSEKDFFVLTEEGNDYSVFKCINNNNGSESTQKPLLSQTSPEDELYQTSDGYIWKLMTTIPESVYNKFSSQDYAPLVSNTEVAAAAIPGALDNILVLTSGSGYDNYTSGTIISANVNSNSLKFYIENDINSSLSTTIDFYTGCAIYITSGVGQGQIRTITQYGFEGNNRFILVDEAFTTQVSVADTFEISPSIVVEGDGTGFRGRAIIESSANSVQDIEIVNPGSGYTYGNVSIEANTAALDVTFTEATARPIISPKNGHGSDPEYELYSKYVTISTEFANTELPTGNNDFSQIGIINNVVFREAILTLDTTDSLSEDDVLTQSTTGITGKVTDIDSVNKIVTFTDVTGTFSTTDSLTVGNSSFEVVSAQQNNEVYDQRVKLDVNVTFGSGFQKDELVVQQASGAKGYVHEFANNVLYLVDTEGDFAVSVLNQVIGQSSTTRALINSITEPGMIDNTGKVIYVENINPITRLDNQSEKINITIGF
jgi:hypothetical protein